MGLRNTNAHDYTTMRCFVSDWFVWFFVKYLQDGFTKLQTHAMTRWCVAFFGLVRLVLCKIFARWVYKIQTHTRTRVGVMMAVASISARNIDEFAEMSECWNLCYAIPKSSFGAAVGNSPLILDESSDHGIGQRYHHLDAISRVIVPKTRQHFRPRYVVLAIVDFSEQ